jgi:hypothetical protein
MMGFAAVWAFEQSVVKRHVNSARLNLQINNLIIYLGAFIFDLSKVYRSGSVKVFAETKSE